jgi:hypothetical protein
MFLSFNYPKTAIPKLSFPELKDLDLKLSHILKKVLFKLSISLMRRTWQGERIRKII